MYIYKTNPFGFYQANAETTIQFFVKNNDVSDDLRLQLSVLNKLIQDYALQLHVRYHNYYRRIHLHINQRRNTPSLQICCE